MRVLFVCSGNSDLGISPIVKSQGESLKRNGIDLEYFTIQGRGFLGYLKNIPKLTARLKNSSYDLVHAHYALSGWVSVLSLSKRPRIISFMGSDLQGLSHIKGGQTYFEKLAVMINRITAGVLYKHIIVKAENMKFRLKTSNVDVIPNGVDFEKFFPIDCAEARRNLNLSLDTKIVFFAADPRRVEKNFQLAKNALNLVSHPKVKLVTVYNKTQDVLNYYYNASDLLVLTSLYEGSPNVIKEAMACNLPIVSTDVGDVREVIKDTDGCYITSFDPSEVAEKIKYALEFGKRTNGKQKIQHLEINIISNKLINLYQKVLNAGY